MCHAGSVAQALAVADPGSWGAHPQDVRQAAVEQLDGIEAQLNAEAHEDEAARSHYGPDWPLQEASIVTANLLDRLAGYRCGAADARPVHPVHSFHLLLLQESAFAIRLICPAKIRLLNADHT